jgi:hypothetical protein
MMIDAIHSMAIRFLDGELDPDRTHAVLLSGSIAAEFAVAIGIIIESPWPKTWRQWLGVVLVIGGVIIGAVSTISLFVFDEGISRGQLSKIAELEQRISVRELDASQQKTVAEMVRAVAPQEFAASIGQGVGDGIVLWQSLYPALANAGWQYVPPSTRSFMMGKPPAGVATVADANVEILLPASTVASTNMVEAAKMLTVALRTVGVWAYPDFDPNDTIDKTIIRIRIGVKTR